MVTDPSLKKTEWKNHLKQCEDSTELNNAAAEIAAEMEKDVPDQSTVLEVMAVLTSHSSYDGTNPILVIAQNENKMDNVSFFTA